MATKTIGISLPPETVEELKAVSKARDMSVSAYVRAAIRAFRGEGDHA